MKVKTLIIFGLIVVTISSCSKVYDKNMTVVKDCTGNYLRYHDKDYLICNDEVVEPFENGTEVKASFEKIESCPDCDFIACQMLHTHEGWITVKEIE
ncbi:MAG TPA: hypothetical protein PKG88_01945 [Bacteroidales bacterium]|mgnify:FL=1|nr:hypothetical protein [Bacteroidales bacterium]